MRKSGVVLKSAIEVAGLGFAELDPEGRFVAVNAAYLSMLGLNESDLLGRHWNVSVHPDDYERTQQAHELARKTNGGYVEIRSLRGDSAFVQQALTVESIRNDQGVFDGYRCLRYDISPEISENNRQRDAWMLAIDSAPSGLLVIDAAGRIQFANRAIENLFGYTREELPRLHVSALVPDLIGPKDTEVVAGRDLYGLRQDGLKIPLQVDVNRVEGSHERLILVTVIDIAERIKRDRQLEIAKERAECANRAKSDFLARMSHEIRTPMGLIMGMNGLLLDSPLNDKQRQRVEISQRNVRRLLRLINGILDLSKVEAGKLILEAVPFDLNEILEECAAAVSAAIEEKGLEFEIFTDLNTGRYWIGDPERLHQVFLNLIGNAIKFSAQGKIELRVHPETGAQGEKGLRFELSDSGCGVPREKIEMIFEDFQQVERTVKRRFEGTGLGLPIAKTLVEKMGGRIWVGEQASPGAKFVFTVFPQPADKEAQRERTTGTAASKIPQAAAGTRVLLVEDNPESVILLRAYLADLPLSLEHAGNGVEALAKRQRRDYDVVLMDVQMPVMDGYTATQKIRSWENAHGKRRVPVVALTAHALVEAAAESIAAGCDGYLTKPVDRQDLIAAIAKFAPPQTIQSEGVSAVIQAPGPTFLPNCWLELRRMQNALAALDFAVLQKIGHDCAANGRRNGFPELANSGAAIESLALALDADGLEKALERFGNSLLAVSNAGAQWAAAGFHPPQP
jgi:PAS domain S-box-containing protein